MLFTVQISYINSRCANKNEKNRNKMRVGTEKKATKNEIGQRIQEIINKFCNGNNSEFARKLNISESTVRNYIVSGNIRIDIIAKIAEIYDIDIEWLVIGKSPNVDMRGNNIYNGDKNIGNNNTINEIQEDKEKELLSILKSTQTELHKIIKQQQEQLTKAQEQISLLINLLSKN